MFTHLHVHTEYSLLDGASKIDDLVTRAAELGMTSLAITDHGNMYGVIKFYKACMAAGIKPIIGCEVYVAPGSRFDKKGVRGERNYYHLILLAENDQGYHNLMKLVSLGYTEGYYYKPRIDKDLLRQYHSGLIASSACAAGEVAVLITEGLYEDAKKTALEYQEIFGKDNYFLELQDHGLPVQKQINAGLLRLHQETGIPMICTNDSHYILPEDASAHDVLLCIQTGKHLADEDRMRYTGGQYYLKSEREMAALFPYAPDALDNTAGIADRCNVTIEFGNHKLPKFDVPQGYTSEEYLRTLCREGLKQRYKNPDPELKKTLETRLETELSIIVKMGFTDYFLIVRDFIKYARDQGYPVGPGRGSATGSLVSYCIGIINIDPIKNNLIFERFLNPERVSMPDIDVDIADRNRQQVIDYVVRKYGRDQVTQIVTFNNLKARQVIRDVGRVMDISRAAVDHMAKLVPDSRTSIDETMDSVPEFRENYEQDPDVHQMIDYARQLEGLPRNTSIHASGVVIGAQPIENYVPLSKGSGQDDPVTTQYTMTELEELGLLKMDFLGLRTLTVIQDAVNLVKADTGENLDIDQIDFNDREVYEMLSRGDSAGVFQLESRGMTSFMKQLKPERMDDLIAGISLFRPGPMQFIPRYIAGKENPETVTYDTPLLEPILKNTNGCMVYQEQVMQIFRDLAGYSMGHSDLVRRAMAKKHADELERERKNFVYGNPEEHIDGAVKRGVPEETAQHLFDEMMDFSSYAFNKSHAAGYAYVAYQTAWLKCHHPAEYMAALMTSWFGSTTRISGYIYDARQMGIEILPPDINEGEGSFTVRDGKIRYGLSAIKGLGSPIVNAIISERNIRGPYKDMYDFASRLTSREVNKRTMENLIKAGALDCLPGTRKQKMQVYIRVIENVAREKKKNISGQLSFFDMTGFSGGDEGRGVAFTDCGEYDDDIKLAMEKSVLGVYVSGHPLNRYSELMKLNCNATSQDFEIDEDTGKVNVKDGREYVVGGIINSLNIRTTRNGDNMASFLLEDMFADISVVAFPKAYGRYSGMIREDSRVFVVGRADVDENQAQLYASRVISFADMPRELWIQLSDMNRWQSEKDWLNSELSAYPDISRRGITVKVYLRDEKEVRTLPKGLRVQNDERLFDELKERYGVRNVVLRYTKANLMQYGRSF